MTYFLISILSPILNLCIRSYSISTSLRTNLANSMNLASYSVTNPFPYFRWINSCFFCVLTLWEKYLSKNSPQNLSQVSGILTCSYFFSSICHQLYASSYNRWAAKQIFSSSRHSWMVNAFFISIIQLSASKGSMVPLKAGEANFLNSTMVFRYIRCSPYPCGCGGRWCGYACCCVFCCWSNYCCLHHSD